MCHMCVYMCMSLYMWVWSCEWCLCKCGYVCGIYASVSMCVACMWVWLCEWQVCEYAYVHGEEVRRQGLPSWDRVCFVFISLCQDRWPTNFRRVFWLSLPSCHRAWIIDCATLSSFTFRPRFSHSLTSVLPTLLFLHSSHIVCEYSFNH